MFPPKRSQCCFAKAYLRFTISESSAYFFCFLSDAKAAMIETIRHVCLASEKVSLRRHDDCLPDLNLQWCLVSRLVLRWHIRHQDDDIL